MTSSTPAFIAAVAPEFAVYTPGYRNRFGHPRAEVVARYDASGIRTYRTDFDGALTFTFAPDAPRDAARRARCRPAVLARSRRCPRGAAPVECRNSTRFA